MRIADMENLYSTLNSIHSKVYQKFIYETDMDQFGVIEKWTMPDKAYNGTTRIQGDCEDFVLACRKLCRDAGLRSRIVLCNLDGEGHAVLEVEGWIFCNNQDKVKSRDDLTNYQWWAISSYEPSGPWELITS